jgi:hypothetical protein
MGSWLAGQCSACQQMHDNGVFVRLQGGRTRLHKRRRRLLSPQELILAPRTRTRRLNLMTCKMGMPVLWVQLRSQNKGTAMMKRSMRIGASGSSARVCLWLSSQCISVVLCV